MACEKRWTCPWNSEAQPAHLVELDDVRVVEELHELDLPVDLLQIARV